MNNKNILMNKINDINIYTRKEENIKMGSVEVIIRYTKDKNTEPWMPFNTGHTEQMYKGIIKVNSRIVREFPEQNMFNTKINLKSYIEYNINPSLLEGNTEQPIEKNKIPLEVGTKIHINSLDLKDERKYFKDENTYNEHIKKIENEYFDKDAVITRSEKMNNYPNMYNVSINGEEKSLKISEEDDFDILETFADEYECDTENDNY